MGKMTALLWHNRLAVSLCVAIVGFPLAHMWVNRAEPSAGTPQNTCNKHITDPPHDPRIIRRPNDSIKIIRLTNSGEFADRCELTNALYELNWDRSLPSYGAVFDHSANHLPKLVVLYIHGWKHNADQLDPDRQHFEDLIRMLRKREKDTKRVVGIYIGWNAEADLWAPLENLTFWSKKNNADRISQSSSVTLIVSSIGAIVHADPDKRDQFVTIGHSFGARMLFSATAQSLITATETAHPGYPGGDYKVVKGVTDAVILLNPAFEASRYSAINDFARDKESFSKDQPPLIITISSTGDWATKSAFPIGQFLGLAWTAREMTTLGNYEPFLTHTLTASDTNACPAKRSAALVETYASDGLCLQRLEEPVNGASDDNPGVVQHFNPFIVARTTSDIIKDHNDIWNEKFITWLAELIHSLQRQNDDISKIKALNAENH